MQEIFPGLYVITRTVTNCYLIESAPEELTVIDAGLPGTEKTILKAVADLNYQPEQVKNILLTHADLDHVGGLAKLVNLTGAKVYSGKESVQYIEAGKAAPHIPSLWAGVMNSFQQPAKVDVALADNERVAIADGILAIHMPGHTPDNFNFFWEKEGVLFGADLFFTLTSNVSLSPGAINWDSAILKKSAIKALELAPKYICPGHGQPVNIVKNPERIANLRRQLEGRASLVAT